MLNCFMPPARFRLFWEVSGAFRAQAPLSDPLHSNYPTRKYGVQAARTRNSAYCPSERSHVLRCPSQLCCRSRADLEKHGERISTLHSVNKILFVTIWSITYSVQKCAKVSFRMSRSYEKDPLYEFLPQKIKETILRHLPKALGPPK